MNDSKPTHRYSPLVIECLLKVYYSPEFSETVDPTPGVKHAVNQLIEADLVRVVNQQARLEVTPRGQAHVQQLCELPLPKKVSGYLLASGEMVHTEDE